MSEFSSDALTGDTPLGQPTLTGGQETNLPATLKVWRRRNGLTQEGAAAEIGTSQSNYSRWEAGTRRPSSAMLTRVNRVVSEGCARDDGSFLEGVRNASPIMLAVNTVGSIAAASGAAIEAFGSERFIGMKLGEVCSLAYGGRLESANSLENFMGSGAIMEFEAMTVFSALPMHIRCFCTSVGIQRFILVTFEPSNDLRSRMGHNFA